MLDKPLGVRWKIVIDYRARTIAPARLQMEVVRVHGYSDFLDAKLVFDSAQPGTGMGHGFTRLSGTKFAVELDARGRARRVVGFAKPARWLWEPDVLVDARGPIKNLIVPKIDDSEATQYWKSLFPGRPQQQKWKLDAAVLIHGHLIAVEGTGTEKPNKKVTVTNTSGKFSLPPKPGGRPTNVPPFRVRAGDYKSTARVSTEDDLPISIEQVFEARGIDGLSISTNPGEPPFANDVNLEVKTTWERVAPETLGPRKSKKR